VQTGLSHRAIAADRAFIARAETLLGRGMVQALD